MPKLSFEVSVRSIQVKKVKKIFLGKREAKVKANRERQQGV